MAPCSWVLQSLIWHQMQLGPWAKSTVWAQSQHLPWWGLGGSRASVASGSTRCTEMSVTTLLPSSSICATCYLAAPHMQAGADFPISRPAYEGIGFIINPLLGHSSWQAGSVP